MSNNRTTDSRYLLYLIIFLVAVYIAVIYMIFDPTAFPYMEAKININGLSFETWKYFFYAHILIGFISLALGPSLLMNRYRKTEKSHKNIGIIYTATVFINSLIVPYLAIYATGGVLTGIVFLILDAAWLATTWVGVWRMAQNKFDLHREWMLRSYCFTMVFLPFRIFVAVISMIFHASNEIVFPLGISMAIVLNLVIVESSIRKNRRKFTPEHNVIV